MSGNLNNGPGNACASAGICYNGSTMSEPTLQELAQQMRELREDVEALRRCLRSLEQRLTAAEERPRPY